MTDEQRDQEIATNAATRFYAGRGSKTIPSLSNIILDAIKRARGELLVALQRELTCGDDDSHFCSKCDTSLYDAKAIVDEAIREARKQ